MRRVPRLVMLAKPFYLRRDLGEALKLGSGQAAVAGGDFGRELGVGHGPYRTIGTPI